MPPLLLMSVSAPALAHTDTVVHVHEEHSYLWIAALITSIAVMIWLARRRG